MFSANEIAGFINQLYLRKKFMNHLSFWHDDIDSLRDGLSIFGWMVSKELSANQISGFLNQLHIKTNWVSQLA